MHVGLTNVDPNRPQTVRIKLDGLTAAGVSGRILTAGAMDAHNTFANPNMVRPIPFGSSTEGGKMTFDMPAKSVAVVTVD